MVFNSDVVIWVYCSYDKSLFRLLSCYGFHFNVWHVIITNTQQRFESSKSSKSYRKVIWLKLNSAGKWTLRAWVGNSYHVVSHLSFLEVCSRPPPQCRFLPSPRWDKLYARLLPDSKALCFLSLYYWRCQSLQLNITSLSSALLWKEWCNMSKFTIFINR